MGAGDEAPSRRDMFLDSGQVRAWPAHDEKLDRGYNALHVPPKVQLGIRVDSDDEAKRRIEGKGALGSANGVDRVVRSAAGPRLLQSARDEPGICCARQLDQSVAVFVWSPAGIGLVRRGPAGHDQHLIQSMGLGGGDRGCQMTVVDRVEGAAE